MNNITVKTPCGEVEGVAENGVLRFLGIPYGSAGRFEYPVEVTHWDGVLKALRYGDAPIQKKAFERKGPGDPINFYEREEQGAPECTYSEDCLNLNIWAPENAEKAPVLVVIFGGGEVSGRTHEPMYDGTALAKKGIIVVFISYRLNIFGFLALKALAEKDGKTGNYAFYDQQTAVEWVRHNIRAFGGDPDNMTLAGQSAGAANCETLIKSPLNKGVFKQAIIQSSAGFTTGLKAKDNRESEYRKWQLIYDKSGCKSLDEFTRLPAEELFRLFEEEGGLKPGFCTTLYDANFGSELKNQPCDTKIMIGITSEDVFPAVLYVFSNILAKNQRKKGIDTYRYFFKRQLPGDSNGAWHSSDLWYFYGALAKCWRPFKETDYTLAETMQKYAANFIKTGDPNGPGLKRWAVVGSGKKDSMVFDADMAEMGRPSIFRLIKQTVSGKEPDIKAE